MKFQITITLNITEGHLKNIKDFLANGMRRYATTYVGELLRNIPREQVANAVSQIETQMKEEDTNAR